MLKAHEKRSGATCCTTVPVNTRTTYFDRGPGVDGEQMRWRAAHGARCSFIATRTNTFKFVTAQRRSIHIVASRMQTNRLVGFGVRFVLAWSSSRGRAWVQQHGKPMMATQQIAPERRHCERSSSRSNINMHLAYRIILCRWVSTRAVSVTMLDSS